MRSSQPLNSHYLLIVLCIVEGRACIRRRVSVGKLLFIVSISIFLVRLLFCSLILLCIYLLIYCDIKVFIRIVSFISLKFSVFNSIRLELWLVLFASYDVSLYYLTLRLLWSVRRDTTVFMIIIYTSYFRHLNFILLQHIPSFSPFYSYLLYMSEIKGHRSLWNF